MNWLKQNWFKVLVLMLILVAFYWYEFRPSQIKKVCFRETLLNMEVVGIGYIDGDQQKTHDYFFNNCLRRKGL
ncbi:MAG: hypothetical protein HYT63_03045 [Candidatus Yanofskybacteria bacterium]|nr:hypothetical protein [Candidatus Yanofskybacteria bacterium]